MTTHLRTAVIVMLMAAGACAGAEEQEVDRGPLGKADAVGSCAATSCDGPAASGNCFCDDDCAHFGDCCSDYVAVCQAPTADPCGGIAGLSCRGGNYCHYELDQRCGAADHLGTCVPIPEACIEIFFPVCGCDGQTYSNSCFAAMAGVSVVSEGECPAG